MDALALFNERLIPGTGIPIADVGAPHLNLSNENQMVDLVELGRFLMDRKFRGVSL